MKKLILEILGIIILATALALIYNSSLQKPFPLMFKERQKKVDSSFTKAMEHKDDDRLNHTKGDVDDPANEEQGFDPNKTISYEQLLEFLDNPNLFLIDARAPKNYKKGTIGEAVNIYPYMDDQDALDDMLFNIPEEKVIVVFCDGGQCDLSHHIAEKLIFFNYDKVFLYSGGWEEWAKKNNLEE